MRNESVGRERSCGKEDKTVPVEMSGSLLEQGVGLDWNGSA